MSIVRFLVRRALLMLITFVVITAVLYGVLMLSPAEARAALYLPRGGQGSFFNKVRSIIETHSLDDPYPVQYARWLGNVLRGEWGWSPALRDDVLSGCHNLHTLIIGL